MQGRIFPAAHAASRRTEQFPPHQLEVGSVGEESRACLVLLEEDVLLLVARRSVYTAVAPARRDVCGCGGTTVAHAGKNESTLAAF